MFDAFWGERIKWGLGDVKVFLVLKDIRMVGLEESIAHQHSI